MKKITSIALTGALALGALAGITAFDAKPAAAAEKPVQYSVPGENWGLITAFDMVAGFEPMPTPYKEQIRTSYKTGDTFSFYADWIDGLTQRTDQVKIFKVENDYSLNRYQTIDWRGMAVVGKNIAIFETKITDNYTPGKYVAVARVNGLDVYSPYFTINK